MINLEKWNPEWTERFTAYEASLQPLFSGGTLHHIGATSIRGLSAQPIIDMLFLVSDEAAVWSAVDTLVDQGYTYIGTERNTETLFTEGAKMYVSHTPEPDLLIFRDILSSDPRVMWAYKQVKESAAPRGELAYNAAKSNFVEAVIRAYKQGTEATSSASRPNCIMSGSTGDKKPHSESGQEPDVSASSEAHGSGQVENGGEETDSESEQEPDSNLEQDSLGNEKPDSPTEPLLDNGQETDTCVDQGVQSPIVIQRGPLRREIPHLSQEIPADMHSINDFSSLLFCGKCGKPLYAESGRYAGVYYRFWKCSSVKRPPFCGANSIRHSVLLNLLDGTQPDCIARIYVEDGRITVFPSGSSVPDAFQEKLVLESEKPVPEQEAPLVIKKEKDKQTILRRPYGHEIPSRKESPSERSKYHPYCGVCHKRLIYRKNKRTEVPGPYYTWLCPERCGVSIRDAVLSNMMLEADESGRVDVFEDRIEVCVSAQLQLGEDNSAIIQRTSFNRELPSISDSQLSYPPLAGPVVCGLCGREMVACKCASKWDVFYTIWKCRSREYSGTCKSHSIRDAVLHGYLEDSSLSPSSVFRTEVFPDHIKLFLSPPIKPDSPVVEKLDDGSTLFHRPLEEFPDSTGCSMLSYPKVQRLPYYGRLFCGNCGERLYRDSNGSYGRKYRLWECRSCNVKSIREAVLEEYIDGIDEYERIEVFSDKVIVKPTQPAHLHDPASPTLLPQQGPSQSW